MLLCTRVKVVTINLLEKLTINFRYIIKYMFGLKKGHVPTKQFVAGKQIVILGNGPNQKLFWKYRRKFEDYDILCVNFFPLENYKLFNEAKPRYICLIDPRFFMNDEGDIALKQRIREMWRNIQNTTWDIIVITISKYRDSVINRGLKCICLSEIVSWNYNCNSIKKYYFRNMLTTGGNTVINYALDFSIIFGYKEIALFGIEHDWMQNMIVDEKNYIVFKDTHDYGEVVRYLPGGLMDSSGGIKRELYTAYIVFRAYYQAAEFSQIANVSVKNYCVNSYVDCFEKIELEK